MNGWTAKQTITLSGTLITATLTNCPITLIGSAFTSSFFATLQSDAKDLRFSSDSAGLVELPREIVYFDSVAEEMIIYVKVDSFTNATNKTIYAWGGNNTVAEPAPRSTSGYQMVWNDVLGGLSYYGVCHFQRGVNSGTLFASDTGFKAGFESSGNWTAVNNAGNIVDTTGILNGQNVWELADSNNIINLEAIDSASSNSTTAFYMEFWINHASYPNSNTPIFVGDFNRYIKFDSSGKVKFGDSGNASTANAPLNTWYHRSLMRTDAGNVSYTLDGDSDGTTSTTQDLENMNRIFMDRNNSGTGMSGVLISGLRITRGSTLGTAHIKTQVNSVDSAATFATAGAVEITPVGYSFTLTGLVVDTEVRVYNSTTRVELAGVEDSTDTFVWNFEHSGNFDVDVHVHNVNYDPIAYVDFTMLAENTTIPIQQQEAIYKQTGV